MTKQIISSLIIAAALTLSASTTSSITQAARFTRPASVSTSAITDADWPQAGRDAQRSNYSPQQINGPYCYDWKWDEAPIASRAQPILLNGRLF